MVFKRKTFYKLSRILATEATKDLSFITFNVFNGELIARVLDSLYLFIFNVR